MEWILALVALLVLMLAVAVPIVALVLAIVTFRRLGMLQRRIESLESPKHGAPTTVAESPAPPPWAPTPVATAPSATQSAAPIPPRPPAARIDLEQIIGRRALGWVAVVLLIFAAAFFLRHAYENQWVGPQGQVGIGILAGLAMVGAGWRHHVRGWLRFSRVLTAAGIVVLFLSVYSSYAFYQLVPEHVASIFMLAVIVLSALVSVLYRSAVLAWMSMLGGLATPLLMASEIDRYPTLFTYLVMLNVGVIVLGRLQRWAGLGSVALIGTHALFWIWYSDWYHPEKLPWALGFHLAIFVLFLALDVSRGVGSARTASAEDLGRLVLNAGLGYGAAYTLLAPDYRGALGLLALALAGLYFVVARWALAGTVRDPRQQLTSLATAVGFLAVAIPIEAQAQWVALGWAAVAATVWWFGLRVREPVLRAMGGALFVLATGRLVLVDILERGWRPEWPILNPDALPALGVVGFLLGTLALAARRRSRLVSVEIGLVPVATVAGLLLLWVVLTVDVHGALALRALQHPEEAANWSWLGQLSVSALSAIYATTLLTIGFLRRQALLRWTALLIFAWTTGKVLLFDMAGLEELYRILAFSIVAVLLGLSGWAYQRLQVGRRPDETAAGG